MGTIVTVSGVSGSGKTTLVDYLLSLSPKHHLVESVTTRGSRNRDRPGEFLHLSPDEFLSKEKQGKFLWVTPPIHGVRYGTLRESVGKALRSDSVSFMIITIEYLQVLRDYVTYSARNITGLYIHSPGETILRERLLKRGDSPNETEERITDCRDWDTKAQQTKTQPAIHFLRNEGTLEDFFLKARLLSIK